MVNAPGLRAATLVLTLLMAWSSVAPAQAPAPQPAIAAPIPGTYRSDRLGLEYRLHPYRGHYGARLTRSPAPGSPLLKLRRPDGSPTYLEPGDMIVTLDDQVIGGPDDVENHVLGTKVTFVNVRTGLTERATAMFPNDAAPAPPPVPDAEPPTVVRPAIGPGESRRVKAVLVVDTATKIDALLGNLAVVRGLLAPLVAEGRCDVTVLQGDDATAGRLVEALRRSATPRPTRSSSTTPATAPPTLARAMPSPSSGARSSIGRRSARNSRRSGRG